MTRKIDPADELACLTNRDNEVLALMSMGLGNKEIAGNLFLSVNTVKRHVNFIFKKLKVHTRSAATAKAVMTQQGNFDPIAAYARIAELERENRKLTASRDDWKESYQKLRAKYEPQDGGKC